MDPVTVAIAAMLGFLIGRVMGKGAPNFRAAAPAPAPNVIVNVPKAEKAKAERRRWTDDAHDVLDVAKDATSALGLRAGVKFSTDGVSDVPHVVDDTAANG